MAITNASLTSGTNTTDATSFTTASITPTANQLVIATVVNTAATAGTPTLSGNGLTWVQIDTQLVAASGVRTTMFRTMGASPSSGAVTIDFGADTQTGCAWAIDAFAGIDTSGTNGSGAVVQSAKGAVDATSITVTLAAFGSTDNGAAFGMGRGRAEASTFDTGWTEIVDTTYSTPNTAIETQWRADNDTTAGASWVTSGKAAGIAIEIKAAAAASDVDSMVTTTY